MNDNCLHLRSNMIRQHIIILVLFLTSCSDTRKDIKETSLPKPKTSTTKSIKTKFKLYDNGKLVDFENSKKFSFDIPHCTDSLQNNSISFNPVDTAYRLVEKIDTTNCSEVALTILKGQQKMKVAGIDRFDSLTFKEGDFFWLSGSNKNTLFERETIGAYNSVHYDTLNLGDSQSSPESQEKQAGIRTFKVDTISEHDFLKHKKHYNSKINFDSLKVRWTDTAFIVKTGNSHWAFNIDRKKISEVNDYYLGFLEPIHLFMVERVYGTNEISDLFLVSSKTEKVFIFAESPFDTPMASPLISPANNFLLSFTNSYYDQWFISIFKIKLADGDCKLQDLHGLFCDKASIEEVVWVNESSFVVYMKTKLSESGAANDLFLKVSFEDK
jgi:hypothetical protein